MHASLTRVKESSARQEGDISEGAAAPSLSVRTRQVRYGGLVGGLVLAALATVLLPADLAVEARATAGVVVLMGTWWLTEAVPIAVTAMLPLILFPAFGLAPIEDVGPSYASGTIFLFLGGFMVALGMQRWNLHKRIALKIVLLVGTKPSRLIAGMMIATGLLGMWVSNTATAMMMIPLGMSLVALVEEQDGVAKNSRFGVGVMLGIAYAATFSAFGTIVASPGNVFVVAYIRENYGYEITFLQWMTYGMPLAVIFMYLGWLSITKLIWKPEVDELEGGHAIFQRELDSLGKMAFGEKAVLAVFLAAALSWIFVPILFVESWASDSVIAMIAGIVVYLIPARLNDGVMVMDWSAGVRAPWGTLILVGGGLALSAQVMDSGLSAWIGQQMSSLGSLPLWLLLPCVVLLLCIMTEFTSSMASITTFVPLVAGVAAALGLNPIIFAVVATQACQCAFMLPVATPPNAIAYGTGAVTIPQMARTGVVMNLLGLVLISILGLVFLPFII